LTLRVGIIAEDASDVDVVTVFLKKLAKKSFSVTPRLAHGSGKLRSHSRSWAASLKTSGCNRLILVHDSDNNSPTAIRAALRSALGVSPIAAYVFVIPVEEIEAWLLADERSINTLFALKPPLKEVKNTEAIANPKEYLGRIIRSRSKKRRDYLPSVDNVKLAAKVTVKSLSKCRSFDDLAAFANAYL
jgi:hypothetical protein